MCNKNMEDINSVHWHDCELESVIEIPSEDKLILNIQYPENWDQNIFKPRSIVFEGYCSQEVNEIPFEGNPTILGASVVSEENDFTTLRLETNAGYRLIVAKCFSFGEQVGT